MQGRTVSQMKAVYVKCSAQHSSVPGTFYNHHHERDPADVINTGKKGSTVTQILRLTQKLHFQANNINVQYFENLIFKKKFKDQHEHR